VNWEEALSLLGAKALSSKWSLSPPFPEELSAIVRAELEGVEAERERWAKWAILAAEVAPLRALLAAQEARAQRVEAALRGALTDILLLNGMDFGADTAAEVMSEARSIARAALSQPAATGEGNERNERDMKFITP
jgi:hypothetical protein